MTRTARTVLITGASSGIGRATALQLGSEGANVVLLSRSRETLETVRDECEALGGRAIVTVADVGDPESLAAAFEVAQRCDDPVEHDRGHPEAEDGDVVGEPDRGLPTGT